MPNPTFKISEESAAEFNRAFKALYYRQKRTLCDFTNKKGYMVALKARRFTPTGTADKIEEELTRDVTVTEHMREAITATGKISKSKRNIELQFHADSDEVPLMVAIIQSRTRPGNPLYRGPSPFYGVPHALGVERMTQLLNRFLKSRKSSAGFFRAGWLAAIKGLGAAYRGTDGALPMTDREKEKMDHLGRMGSFEPATEVRMRAKIVNNALSRFDKTKRGLIKVGERALQKAMEEETESMRDEVFRRMAKDAEAAGIKVRGIL